MKIIFDEDEDLYEYALTPVPAFANNEKDAPDFEVPSVLWAEFKEAQRKFFDLHSAVIVRSLPLTANARELQKRVWNGLQGLKESV